MSIIVSVDSSAIGPVNNSHDMTLSDGTTTHGYILDGASRGIIEAPYTPSTLQFNLGRRGYDSFEAPYTSEDQVNFTGGRGQLKFEDRTKFYDSYNMWTLTDGLIMPAPLWRFAQGLRNGNTWMPGDNLTAGGSASTTLAWQAMSGTDNSRYLAHKFTTTAEYSVESIGLLLRYHGTPGTLSVAIYTDSSNPNSAVANSTVQLTGANASIAAPEGELVGQLVYFVPTTSPTLSTTTNYWVVIWCAASDNSTNYWEVAYGNNGGTAARSLDGSAWTSTSARAIYYRVTAAVTDAKIHFFEYKRAIYAATEPLNGSAGKIYLNGDRGVATGTSSTSTLQDTTKSWTVNEWKNAYVRIWNGTGEGQFRKIASNTSDTLTISTTGPLFDVTPVEGNADTGSEYNIIGTRKWKDVTPTTYDSTGISKPITDVMTCWGVIYLCQGESAYILKLREYNETAVWDNFWTSGADSNNCSHDGTNVAKFIERTYDPVNENFIWIARNVAPGEWGSDTQTSVYKADDVFWGSNLSFGNPVPIGTRDYLINKLTVYNNKLWVGKEDSIWYVDYDGSYDRAYPLDIGLDAITSPDNCKAMMAKDLFLYFNWAYSVERLYGSTLDDIGPWRGTGLIKRALGNIVHLEPAIGWIFGAVDAGNDKQSSIMGYQNGWHTLFRAPSYVTAAFGGRNKNPRIRSIHWQSIEGEDATNFMWFECGGDIMFMQMPKSSLNPSLDDNLMFAPESYIIQSRMDIGYSELEKYYDKVRIVSPAIDGTIYVDCATNATLDEPDFDNYGSGTTSPSFNVTVDESRKRNIMVRTRISVSALDDTAKNNIEAIVVDAVSRTHPKRQWTCRVILEEDQKTFLGEKNTDPYTLYGQVWTWADQAQELTLRSRNPYADADGSGRSVMIEPPSIQMEYIADIEKKFKAYLTFVLREL